MAIEEAGIENLNEWEKYEKSLDKSTFVDNWTWRKVIEKVYKLSNYWYLAKNDNKIEGLLALTLTKHPIFGTYLVTAPFANQGGFYADSETAFNTLLCKAKTIQRELNTRYVNIRHLDGGMNPPNGWQQDAVYAT